MNDLEQQVAQVLTEIDAGVADAKADYPGVNDDDLYYEIMNSILTMHPAPIRKEVRFRLGFDWRSE